MNEEHTSAQEIQNPKNHEVSDAELKTVIADFLEMGHVDNIVAMFKQEPAYYNWTGEILTDERFAVRLGVSVLFEELMLQKPEDTPLAIPSLVKQLANTTPFVRGEAISVLGIIGTEEALAHIRNAQNDPDPQVQEVISDILQTDG